MTTPPDPVSAARQLIQLNEANPYCDLTVTCWKEMHRHLEGLALEIANALISLSSREGAMRVALEEAAQQFDFLTKIIRRRGDQVLASSICAAADDCREAALSSPGSPREDGWRPKFQNSQQFAALCADHPLPWNFDIDYTAIVDAEGGYVIELADTRDRNLRLGNMLLVGVNTCGGFRAQVDGAWSATTPLQPGSAQAEKEANSANKS